MKGWLCPRISKVLLSYGHSRAVWLQVCECASISLFRSKLLSCLQGINKSWALSSVLWCWPPPRRPYLLTSLASKYCLSSVFWGHLLWAPLSHRKSITEASSLPRHISPHFNTEEIISGIGNWLKGPCWSRTCGEGRDLIFLWGKITSETVFDCWLVIPCWLLHGLEFPLSILTSRFFLPTRGIQAWIPGHSKALSQLLSAHEDRLLGFTMYPCSSSRKLRRPLARGYI